MTFNSILKLLVTTCFEVFTLMLAIGCSGGGSSHSEGAPTLRQHWANGWVAASNSGRLRQAYDMFITTEGVSHRGSWFATLAMVLAMDIEHYPISGAQLLDLVGPPDRSKELSDGTTVLIFFVHAKETADASAVLVTLSSTGNVTEVGINTADVAIRQLGNLRTKSSAL